MSRAEGLDERDVGVATDDLTAMLSWLDDHTNFELSMPARSAAPTLERIKALCDLLGNPELACPVIHLTGTNGKGSTARMLTELLGAKGLVVGTYTSPNLHRVNERLAREGEPITDGELTDILLALQSLEQLLAERPTRFELLTAAAFRWFADVAVDVAVVEVGLGGRWDATNVVDPEVAVVTNVSFDHVEILGPTLVDIAREKAGIIKAGSRVVVGESEPSLEEVFRRAADEAGTLESWFRGVEFACEANRLAVGGRMLELRTPGGSYEDLYLPLHGSHQGENAACAVAAAEAFFGAPLHRDVVQSAFDNVMVPGRLEVLGREPLVVLDGAHNVAGAQALAQSLLEEFHVEGERVAVVGMLQGRDPRAMLRPLAASGISTVVACFAPSPRSLSAIAVAEAARAEGMLALSTDDARDAVTLARSKVAHDGLLVVTGSLYVVAQAREVLLGGSGGAKTPDRSAGHE